MIFNTKATQKNAGQKLTDICLTKGKSNELWSELDETSQAAVSGGALLPTGVIRGFPGGDFGIVAGDITPIEEIGYVVEKR